MSFGHAWARVDSEESGLAMVTKKEESIEIAQEIDQHLQAVRQILKQPLESEFASGELTGPQRSVMQALVQADGLSLKQLSKVVGLAHSTVSGIVDRLERRGLVRRMVGEPDRRVTRIVVTDHILDLVRKHSPGLNISPLVSALNRATPAEQAAIVDGLRKLRRLLATSADGNKGV